MSAATFDASGRLVASLRGPSFGSTLGAYALRAQTGGITATLSALSALFSFRWGNAANLCVIDRITVDVVISSAITTAVQMGLEAVFARSFTGSDSGGTAVSLTGNAFKKRTDYGTTLLTDARFASTGALTNGTRTLDTQAFAGVHYGTGTAVGSTPLAATTIYAHEAGRSPVIFEQDEGFIIRNSAAGPATGVFVVGVTVEWIETAAYVA